MSPHSKRLSDGEKPKAIEPTEIISPKGKNTRHVARDEEFERRLKQWEQQKMACERMGVEFMNPRPTPPWESQRLHDEKVIREYAADQVNQAVKSMFSGLGHNYPKDPRGCGHPNQRFGMSLMQWKCTECGTVLDNIGRELIEVKVPVRNPTGAGSVPGVDVRVSECTIETKYVTIEEARKMGIKK